MSTIVPLCLSLLLFFQVSIAQFSFGGGPLYSSRGFRGDSVSQHQCRFEHLAALEVTHRDRSEAGFIEYYNTEVRNEFRCAGVSVRRLVIESHGVFGMALLGYPETFQSVRSAFVESSTQKLSDEHQQLHKFRQGDVIAVSAGVAHWLYNNGDSPMEFFLAGKPTSWQQEQYSYQAEQQSDNQNIFAGFNPNLLGEALGVSRQTTMRLQELNDQRGAIIRVEQGLQALHPSFQTEQVQEEQSQEQQQQPTWSGRGCAQNNGLD
uniref:Cupin type-1 domain-containing protein n=1 Tax=Oryza meridionalis TaxID=40149 RepID=A0A0E0CK41_9ORYZ